MNMALTIVVALVVLAAVAVVALLAMRRAQRAETPEPAVGDLQLGADPPHRGWHGPSASGGFPAVPEQRTGEHERAPAARLHRWRR
jgi:hypothetical protein